MKTYKLFTLSLIIAFFSSCTDDPLAYIFEDGSEWNNERSIKDLIVEGQIGTCEIINSSDESIVTLTIDPEAINNWSEVAVSYLGLSWNASSDIIAGSFLNLDNPEKTCKINVTSESGLSREWTIRVEEFANPVSGTWSIQDYKYSYDDYYGWGNSAYDVDLYLKLPSSEPGLDDMITFGSVDGVLDGMPYGNYSRTSGENNEFASYIHNDVNDFGPMFGQIPAGDGTYYITQDADGATIIKIITTEGDEYTSGEITKPADNKINIKLAPTMRNLGLIDWDNYYAPYTSFVSCVDIYYNLVKQ